MQIKINVNGENKTVEIKPHEYILDTLRGLGYYSVRRGCDTTSCGLCTILVDKKPILSCSTFAAKCDGHSITTVEGTGDEGKRLAKYIVEEGVDQCGYCSPGFILTVLSMKDELTNPTDDEIKHYLNNNLCRCTGYEGQLRAIRKFLKEAQ
ncbi:xanthine dehydrogenase, iron-sulfur binding subunit XdhC [Gottschalkia acidurici 9a]|uniref:Xanthine dehydrogenase, iron-sulfur binding subunit XdhC n=1 Tax=Gottschalkia acidurici (strain ATCC 7906 / DSM 604 / BCRC 14475 / CIP 104303 / KCTC 5404 / NCIMB 10678 / 9a) TaxID=1128398 RepID=K0B4E4_GOTA9|nr:2Fe-2S iron-sulfur cluster-binding protein [Gottschalkia acidurici]AFS79386.1 xanthine dehydrogenase, iron-sulfur binding subunit XdhC [Gottschalkia acidurici 9a]